jgi:hypothetical protein
VFELLDCIEVGLLGVVGFFSCFGLEVCGGVSVLLDCGDIKAFSEDRVTYCVLVR